MRFMIALLLALSLSPGVTQAAPVVPEAARALVTSLLDEVDTAFAKGMSVQQRTVTILHLLDKYSSSEMIGHDILGLHWEHATAAERKAFSYLFGGYIVATRVPNADEPDSNDSLEVGGSEAFGEKAIVHSVLKSPGSDPTPVDWVVVAGPNGHPAIADISSGGISLIKTMNADFTSVIRTNAGKFAALLDAMGKKAGVTAPM